MFRKHLIPYKIKYKVLVICSYSNHHIFFNLANGICKYLRNIKFGNVYFALLVLYFLLLLFIYFLILFFLCFVLFALIFCFYLFLFYLFLFYFYLFYFVLFRFGHYLFHFCFSIQIYFFPFFLRVCVYVSMCLFTFNTDGTTGEYSLYTQFLGNEIMFHVSVLLPFSETNKQQVRANKRAQKKKKKYWQ